MDQTITRPVRWPQRAHPGRRRRHERPGTPHVARRVADDATAQTAARVTEQPEPQMQGGGGSSGRGRGDDDGGGRRPDRDGQDALRLLIALGILAVGAGVMTARRFAKTGRA